MMAAGISILLPLEEHDYTITFPVKEGEIIADKVRKL